jgi:hypothetical protein
MIGADLLKEIIMEWGAIPLYKAVICMTNDGTMIDVRDAGIDGYPIIVSCTTGISGCAIYHKRTFIVPIEYVACLRCTSKGPMEPMEPNDDSGWYVVDFSDHLHPVRIANVEDIGFGGPECVLIDRSRFAIALMPSAMVAPPTILLISTDTTTKTVALQGRTGGMIFGYERDGRVWIRPLTGHECWIIDPNDGKILQPASNRPTDLFYGWGNASIEILDDFNVLRAIFSDGYGTETRFDYPRHLRRLDSHKMFWNFQSHRQCALNGMWIEGLRISSGDIISTIAVTMIPHRRGQEFVTTLVDVIGDHVVSVRFVPVFMDTVAAVCCTERTKFASICWMMRDCAGSLRVTWTLMCEYDTIDSYVHIEGIDQTSRCVLVLLQERIFLTICASTGCIVAVHSDDAPHVISSIHSHNNTRLV